MSWNKGNSLSERELVRLVGNGDPRGQRELYQRYAGILTAVAARYLQDQDQLKDVLQDAFIRIFDRFYTFRYRGEGSLRAWMSRIVANGALQALRRDSRLLPSYELPETLPEEDPDVDEVPMEVLQQMKHKEIAELLGIKENSSASQLLRAKALLAKEIKEYKKNGS